MFTMGKILSAIAITSIVITASASHAAVPTTTDECMAQFKMFIAQSEKNHLTHRMKDKLGPMATAMVESCKAGKFVDADKALAQLEATLKTFKFRDHDHPDVVKHREAIEAAALKKYTEGHRTTKLAGPQLKPANKDECLVQLHGLILESRSKRIDRVAIAKLHRLITEIDEDCHDGKLGEASVGLANMVAVINALPVAVKGFALKKPVPGSVPPPKN